MASKKLSLDCAIRSQEKVILTLEEKVEILRRLEVGEAASKLVREYGIGTVLLPDCSFA